EAESQHGNPGVERRADQREIVHICAAAPLTYCLRFSSATIQALPRDRRRQRQHETIGGMVPHRPDRSAWPRSASRRTSFVTFRGSIEACLYSPGLIIG